MNFTADENIDTEVIESLRNNGYSVLSISESFPGIPDDEVLEIAIKNNTILITGDKDFGELVFRHGKAAYGVILIRVFGISQSEKAQIVLDAFDQYSDRFEENFTVIGKNKIRIKVMG